MNTRILAVCLLAACAALSLTAQTTLFSDSLASSSSNWTSLSPNPPNEGGGDLEFGNSRLGYTVASPEPSDVINNTGYLTYIGSTPLSGSSSWSAQVDVNLAAFTNLTLTQGQFINLNLAVVKASDAQNYMATMSIDRFSGGMLVRGFESYVKNGGPSIQLPSVMNATTSATLLISFDATAKTLTYAYDADGGTGGYNFTYAAATNIGSSWSPSGESFFGIALVGSSGTMNSEVSATGPVVDPADAYFTNFAIKTGVTIEGTPVPEPSTYAAIAGLLALGFACWRRRAARTGN